MSLPKAKLRVAPPADVVRFVCTSVSPMMTNIWFMKEF